MAIVTLSKRFLDINKNNSIIGPGEYEPIILNGTKNKTYFKNIPFNSSQDRICDNFQESNPIVGPGSYFREEKNFFIKKSFNKKKSEFMNENNIIDYNIFQLMNNKKNLQKKQIKLIKLDRKDKKQIINYSNSNNSKKFISIPVKRIKNSRSNSVSTISKTQKNLSNNDSLSKFILSCINYGQKKEKLIENDNNSNIIEKNENLSSNIDSNFYPLLKSNNKHNNNLSTFLVTNTSNSNITNNKNTSNIIEKKLSRNYKGTLYKISYKHNKDPKKDENYTLNKIFNISPGPGYYENKSNFDKYRSRNDKHNFDSNKNFHKTPEKTENLGPGSYYPYFNNNFTKINFYPFNSSEERYCSNFLYQNDLGPGEYDIKSQFNNKNKTNIKFNEKRFFNINKTSTLGPGQYLPLINWENNNNSLNLNLDKNINKSCEYIPKITEGPSVGEYNPDIIKSIKYKILSHDNKKTDLKAPFLVGQQRFFNKSTSTPEMVGPGSYEKNTKNILKKVINNSKLDKSRKKNKVNDIILKDLVNVEKIKKIFEKNKMVEISMPGPGSYLNDNYNDWNKKTFNFLYV